MTRTGTVALVACDWARARLPLFIGRDLEPRAGQRVRDHLMACGDCRRELLPLVRARDALRAAAANAPVAFGSRDDDAFFAALHRDVMAEVRGAPASQGTRSPVLLRALPMAAAAVLFVAGLLVVGWMSPGDGLLDRRPIPPVASPASFQRGEGVALVPLANIPGDGATPATIQGMRGRLSLRTLEQDWILALPAPRRAPADESASPKTR